MESNNSIKTIGEEVTEGKEILPQKKEQIPETNTAKNVENAAEQIENETEQIDITAVKENEEEIPEDQKKMYEEIEKLRHVINDETNKEKYKEALHEWRILPEHSYVTLCEILLNSRPIYLNLSQDQNHGMVTETRSQAAVRVFRLLAHTVSSKCCDRYCNRDKCFVARQLSRHRAWCRRNRIKTNETLKCKGCLKAHDIYVEALRALGYRQ